ncbi:MAG: DUF6261 family protein [Bacteroidales bacterium]|jgi:hypothetical protein|nr:DUF6261 family protein [Bacteroidales bacterium]
MKIIRFDLKHLRNEEHFQLMSDFKKLAEAVGVSALYIDRFFAAFVVLLDKENLALEVIRKSELTAGITEADERRDNVYRGFLILLESYLHSPRSEKVEAARHLRIVTDHYGDFRNKPYNEETASITNFVQEVYERCAADLDTLNAGEWISELSAANQTFDELMNRRFDRAAEREYVSLRETRNEIDKIYAQMVEFIDASVILNGGEAHTGFVNRLNERVQYYKSTLAQRKGRSAAKKTENKKPE